MSKIQNHKQAPAAQGAQDAAHYDIPSGFLFTFTFTMGEHGESGIQAQGPWAQGPLGTMKPCQLW